MVIKQEGIIKLPKGGYLFWLKIYIKQLLLWLLELGFLTTIINNVRKRGSKLIICFLIVGKAMWVILKYDCQ